MTASDHDISSPTSSVGAEPRAPAPEAGSKPQPIQDSKPAHKPKHNKQQKLPTEEKKSKHRPVQSFEHVFSESKQKLPPTPSLPELNLTTYPRELAHKTYAQRYAASFGDASDFSDTEDPCADGVPSTENAKVLEFHPAAQRQPAMRVGAARLSEMMMYGRRSNQTQPVAVEALAVEAAAEDAKKKEAAVKRRNRRKHNRDSQPADG
ncbi:hypothetical protein BX661DRAFT_213588 [Kickxella alabastrina]|uniref:uncharacterized protein n=1 Tax=Kickxella alabastrina TaxID=61397 RepID=UPI00221EF621|nr:uncharacterized protein BX661DRAFT_213588 [Kickxella alabastrina]KAI7826243.1 hypothetical protein BX661DRAFT_213588 [Kickxella alabastrina]